MNSTYGDADCGHPSAWTGCGVERPVSRPDPSSAQWHAGKHVTHSLRSGSTCRKAKSADSPWLTAAVGSSMNSSALPAASPTDREAWSLDSPVLIDLER